MAARPAAAADASRLLFPGTTADTATTADLDALVGVDARAYAPANGGDDWTTAVSLALADTTYDEATQTYPRRTVLLPATLRLTAPLLLPVQTAALRGNHGGTTIDATAITDGHAIRISGNGDDERVGTKPWRQTLRDWLHGISLLGPGADAGNVTGILFDTPDFKGLPATGHGAVRNAAIQGFARGVGIGQNAYAVLLDTVNVFECGTCVELLEATNSGENVRLMACTLFDSRRGVVCSNRGGDVVLTGCSVDFCDDALVTATRGRVALFGCHLESDRTTPWLDLDEDGSAVELHGCELVVAGAPRSTPLAIIPTTVGSGGLTVSAGRLVFAAAPTTPVLFDGGGRVQVLGAPGLRRRHEDDRLPPFARQLNLVPGAFDTVADVDAWTLTLAERDDQQAGRGAASLRLGDGTDGTPSAAISFDVRPGHLVTVGYACMGGSRAGPATAELRWTRDGRPAGKAVARLPLNATGTTFTTVAHPPVVAPSGVDGATLQFAGVAPWPEDARLWIDDVIVNAL